ncbi:MAG: hypothetical protein ACE5K4_05895 [Candidatus Hydrothermarchaeota archaeon]
MGEDLFRRRKYGLYRVRRVKHKNKELWPNILNILREPFMRKKTFERFQGA